MTSRRPSWFATPSRRPTPSPSVPPSTSSRRRGRGIAKAMIDRTLTASAARGLSHTTLGVDTADPTGAHALYTGLGFVRTARNVGWAKPVDADRGRTDP
ncbi:GNAT family N-acetyltransferase [Euzebya rosea]|uniref:GNAT family N-acetyltransferase n=1 Tax=Euzebya rosea TaxID=2052804 RepID=UPI0030B85747